MTSSADSPSRVLVILDREFGQRLRAVWPEPAIWIELSPVNQPVVHALWKNTSEPTHLIGITGLPFQPSIGPEERFLAELDMIDLHHGACSTNTPYIEITVLGCRLTNRIRTALAELGFDDFEEQDLGFVARRTSDQAAIRR